MTGLRIVLLVGVTLSVWTTATLGTVRSVPVVHHVDAGGEPAVAGEVRVLTVSFEGRSAVQVDGVVLQGPGGAGEPRQPGDPLSLTEGERATLRFRITPGEDFGALEFSYLANGELHRDPVRLDAEAARGLGNTGRLQRATDAPGPLFPTGGADRAPVGTLPAVFEASLAANPAETAAPGAWTTYTVTGTVRYRREDGLRVGVDGATVKAIDFNLGFPDIPLGNEVTTDENGYFSLTFQWLTGLPTDPYPDVVIQVWAINSWVTVADGGNDPDIYVWRTPVQTDVQSTTLNVGTWDVEGRNYPAHVLTTATRGVRWFQNEWGQTPPRVSYRTPDGDGAYYTHGTDWTGDPYYRIHMDQVTAWEEFTILHELGHHIINSHATLPTPDYCNGFCDDPGDCGHCRWCPENGTDAFSEGWAYWFGYVILEDWVADYGYAPDHGDYPEYLKICHEFTIPAYGDPWFTEGFLIALLVDIDDANNEKDPFGSAVAVDALSLGHGQILTVTFLDDPRTPVDFINKFHARYPSHASGLWFTAANNGYYLDDQAPDTQAPVSSSHTVGVPSADLTPTLLLTGSDDWSGIQGYSVRVQAGGPVAPVQTMTHPGESSWTNLGPLNPGTTYYVTVRAIDNNGNWDPGYETFGALVMEALRPHPPGSAFPYTGTAYGTAIPWCPAAQPCPAAAA